MLPAGLDKTERPWIKPYAALPPAAQQVQPHGAEAAFAVERRAAANSPREAKPMRRKRPFIYVYDMEPTYTALMLQASCRLPAHAAVACRQHGPACSQASFQLPA